MSAPVSVTSEYLYFTTLKKEEDLSRNAAKNVHPQMSPLPFTDFRFTVLFCKELSGKSVLVVIFADALPTVSFIVSCGRRRFVVLCRVSGLDSKERQERPLGPKTCTIDLQLCAPDRADPKETLTGLRREIQRLLP